MTADISQRSFSYAKISTKLCFMRNSLVQQLLCAPFQRLCHFITTNKTCDFRTTFHRRKFLHSCKSASILFTLFNAKMNIRHRSNLR